MGDWDVVSTTPAQGARPAGEWDVISTAPARVRVARRGGAAGSRPTYEANNGRRGLLAATGSSPDNPFPAGENVPVGAFGMGPDGSVSLRTRTGWNLVRRPNPLTRFEGFASTQNRRAEAERSPNRPQRRPRETNALAQVGADLAEPLKDAGNAWRAAWNSSSNPDRAGSNPLDREGFGNALLATVTAPIAVPINAVTRPLARGLTDLGVGNDDYWNDQLNLVASVIIPERGGVARAAANTSRFSPVTGSRPTVAEALNNYANRPPRVVPRPNTTPAPVTSANALADPVPSATPANRRMSQVNLLRREGVELTPGQRRGGLASSLEDKATSTPILGEAITDARTQSNLALNRAVANRALAPIGERLPGGLEAGNETVAYVEGRIGDAYTRAAGMVKSAQADNDLLSALDGLRQSNNIDLPPSTSQLFDQIIAERVTARFANGPVDGAMLKEIQSEIGGLAAKYGSSTDGAQRILGERLQEVRQAVGELVARSSPEAASLQSKADKAWANFVRYQTAAARGGEGGVFTPAQLRAAVKASDKSVRKGAVARGDALMQDLADAAVAVMQSKTADSGTAGRSMSNGLALMTGANPVAGALTAGVLGAASIPYRVLARRLALAATKPGVAPEEMATALEQLRGLEKLDPEGVAQWVKRVEQAAKVYGVASVVARPATPSQPAQNTP